MKKMIKVNAPKLYIYTYSHGRPNYKEINPWWWKLRNWLRGYNIKKTH